MKKTRTWLLLIAFLQPDMLSAGGDVFVSRSGSRLIVDGNPAYFLGSNAYALMEHAARGDSGTVRQVLSEASGLGMTIVRTWAFFDAPDSSNPAIIQYRPGAFNESALRALDYVVWQATSYGLRLVLPLVNSWDDYGGMNQYVRWRAATSGGATAMGRREAGPVVMGSHGRSYALHVQGGFSHDDFYTDSLIQSWYSNYVTTILNRTNTLTGREYKDEPCILAWELANEPRSSDRSGTIVHAWLQRMAALVRSIDQHHLVGSGEEGFDVSPQSFSVGSYNGQSWLFDGTAGISFGSNLAIPELDFGSIHLYPDSWNILRSAGSSWIEDHLRIADGMQKPLMLGEFGVVQDKAATYESWLTSGLLDGIAGAAVWQLLDSTESDPEGFGITCPAAEQVCSVLESVAEQFRSKSNGGSLLVPEEVTLLQNYPNPFNRQTIISYTLPFDAPVELVLFNTLGERVRTVVAGFQHAGTRKELLDGLSLASGAYFYTLHVSGQPALPAAKKLLLIR